MEQIDQAVLENYDVLEEMINNRQERLWKGIDKQSKTAVTIKLIPKPESSSHNRSLLIATKFPRHENILKFQKIIQTQKDDVLYAIYEYFDMNMLQLMKKDPAYNGDDICSLTYQLLEAVKFMHNSDLILRNLNPTSILIGPKYKLMLTRCGSALFNHEPNTVITPTYFNPMNEMYYAPEILLQGTKYTSAADMWSVGCILGALLLRIPLFPATRLSIQLQAILGLVGNCTDSDLDALEAPEARAIFRSIEFTQVPWSTKFPNATAKALDLLQKLLQINPAKRLTAEQALNHPYITELFRS